MFLFNTLLELIESYSAICRSNVGNKASEQKFSLKHKQYIIIYTSDVKYQNVINENINNETNMVFMA